MGITLLIPLLLAFAQDSNLPTFGTTVYSNVGFMGVIYNLKPGTSHLPKFAKLKPEGTIYTPALDIPVRDFRDGFPGVTQRYEWFAIDYTGKFWIEQDALYRFSLTSDDGARLFIDDHEVINNDGLHPPTEKTGRRDLAHGVHSIHVEYMQGPAEQVALILQIAGPGEDFHVFNLNSFKPPASVQ